MASNVFQIQMPDRITLRLVMEYRVGATERLDRTLATAGERLSGAGRKQARHGGITE